MEDIVAVDMVAGKWEVGGGGIRVFNGYLY